MNVIRIKWALLKYARTHKLQIPPAFAPRPLKWGKPAQTLAWRATAHARTKHGYKGDVGTQAADAQVLLLPPSLGTLAVRYARKEVGVHEVPAGSNYGPRVKVYQTTTGLYRQPWCASFLVWCYREAGYKGPLPSSPAWVPAWAASAKTRKPPTFCSVARIALRRGDFVTLWGNKHIELFDKWIVPGVLAQCIGGNTAVTGRDNNGGAVCRTRRYAYEMTSCGRVRRT